MAVQIHITKAAKALITEIDAEKAKAQRERFKGALRARIDSVKWAKGSVVSAMKSLDERTKELDKLKAMSAEEYCEKNPGYAQGGVVMPNYGERVIAHNNMLYGNCVADEFGTYTWQIR